MFSRFTVRFAAVAVVLLGVFGSSQTAHAASPVVPFADARLKLCVQQTLGSSAPEVTLAELQSLTTLECEGKEIVDVTPLGRATSLTALRLGRNTIASLPSLAALTSLKKLDLSENDLADLSPLAGLSELENLDVRYNRLQSIAVLNGLQSLQTVSASFNSITSVGSLSTLNDLDAVDLSHNAIAAAAAFAGGAVLREVNLSFNLLTDVQFASRLTQLTRLDLGYNRVTSAVPLGSLKAEVELRNQSVPLPTIAVDVASTTPSVRSVTLDPLGVLLASDSQACGVMAPGGFVWRSNGVGQLVWAETVTRPAGNVISFSGRFTQVITRGALTAPTPTVSGTAANLQVLTAAPGTWGPAPVALSYQWKREGVPVGGATNPTYTLGSADVGTKMSVAVTGTKASYATATKESAQTAAVAGLTLTATPVPTISGTAKVALTLTANSGAWAPATVNLAYQWLGGGVTIAGATASTYTVKNADAGSTITVRVTGTKAGYATVVKTSAATALVTGGVIAPGTPTISGSVALGKVLTAVPGTWTPAPVSYSYQWNRDGVAITGAVGATHTVPTADLGKAITVTVTGSRPGFATVSRTSARAGVPK
ncbi:hypothetical protein B7R22_16060 [Subtercola boreus]|uniref:Ig-like domain-containing protein n=1 Tax=Subtercola boreus TaxID=120213 RepID=A0A3E0VTU4_9MICO|nr:leucine-rich repeat domain-containing protein [Subtercola boreus]RFA12317.1 hypothetical protein B7R22_16060 [Subtercola boreus]